MLHSRKTQNKINKFLISGKSFVLEIGEDDFHSCIFFFFCDFSKGNPVQLVFIEDQGLCPNDEKMVSSIFSTKTRSKSFAAAQYRMK